MFEVSRTSVEQCPNEAPTGSPRVCYDHRCRYVGPHDHTRCEALAKRVEEGSDDCIYVVDTRSFFCETHEEYECKGALITGWPCFNQLPAPSTYEYCDSHQCSNSLGGRSRKRCINRINNAVVGGWPVCSPCDNNLGCPAKLRNRKRCSAQRYSIGTYCYNHTCRYYRRPNGPRCLCPRISEQEPCEEHAGCHFKVGNARCREHRLRKGAPCDKHTCHYQPLGYSRCVSQAERAGKDCLEHAMCAWSLDC